VVLLLDGVERAFPREIERETLRIAVAHESGKGSTTSGILIQKSL
jgi:hypothetical protein